MMNRIKVSMGIGLIVFVISIIFIGDLIMALISGIFVAIILACLTDKGYIQRRKKKRDIRNKEKEEARKWKRESYHKERGRQIAKEDSEKEKEYNHYNEFDIRNISPRKKLLEKFNF